MLTLWGVMGVVCVLLPPDLTGCHSGIDVDCDGSYCDWQYQF